MKKLNFKRDNQIHSPITYWELNDDIVVAIYQGSRGGNPELDYIVKYQEPTKRLRTPSHTHWIVDLLIKADYNQSLVKDFIEDWIEIYQNTEPFRTKEERESYNPVYTQQFVSKYKTLNQYGEFSIEFISLLIELFIKCEKQTENAFMFKSMLFLMKEYCDNKKDFYQVISHSKRV